MSSSISGSSMMSSSYPSAVSRDKPAVVKPDVSKISSWGEIALSIAILAVCVLGVVGTNAALICAAIYIPTATAAFFVTMNLIGLDMFVLKIIFN